MKKELVRLNNLRLEYSSDMLELNKTYKVYDCSKDRRKQVYKTYKLKLVGVNKHYLTFEDRFGIKTCFPNHQGLIKLKEI